MNRTLLFISLLTSLGLLAGCAVIAERAPENVPLTRVQAQQTVSGLQGRGSGEVLLVLSFSGGGSRAAALAYGVLEGLRDTPLDNRGRRSLLDEVDMISAVSGGSVTAAYYGLFGERLFSDFRQDFLRRNVTQELKDIVLSAGTLTRISSETFGTGDVLDEYFRQQLFGSATLDQLLDGDGPFVQINATDLFKGGQFGFTRDQFALICSDVTRFPVSRAVAASSAVPVLFTPITLTNHAGSCDYVPPPWLLQGLQEKGVHNRRYRIANYLHTYLERQAHPYIHLVDGGLADNLGLRAVMDYIVIEGGLWNTLQRFNLTEARDILLVSVDASALLPSQWEQSPNEPPTTAILDAATTTPLVNNNFETLEYLHSNLASWREELQRHKCRGSSQCQAPEIYHIELQLEDLTDPASRKRLTSVPTDFALEPKVIGELIDAGQELLYNNPEFRRWRNTTTVSAPR
jgi:NTE family protein